MRRMVTRQFTDSPRDGQTAANLSSMDIRRACH
jgi:hypothetical protein